MKNIDEDTKEQIKILKDFVLNIDCLEELNKYKNDVNFFEITGMVHREIKHSNFLAWAFDSNGSHRLGSSVVKKFIQLIIETNETKFNSDDVIKFSLLDYSDFIIRREWENLDIFMVSKSQKITITIENKIHAEEGENQTKRYRELIESTYKDYQNIFIFLTIDGYLPEDEDYWCEANYYQVVEALEYALSHTESKTSEVEYIIKDYITMVRRKILMDDKVQELCYKIYKNNKEAFDLIYRNLPNEVSYAKSYLIDVLSSEKIKEKYHIRSIDRYSKNSYIRFTTDNILKVFPDNNSPKGSWDKSFLFMYEIHPQANGSLLLEGVISNTTDENIIKAHEISKENGFITKNASLTKWARIFTVPIMDENLSGLFIEEIKEQIDKALPKALDIMTDFEEKVINKII